MAANKPSKGLKGLDRTRIVEQFKNDRTPFSTLAEEHGVAPSVIVSVLEADAPDLLKAYWEGRGADTAHIPVAAPVVETATFESISPQAARAYLIHNTTNRSISETVVRRYLADIQAGRWKRNGASIVFGRSGRLLDGQHRLEAIARGDTVIESVVVRNADDDAFDTIDSGKSRSLTDIVGLMNVAHAKIASPAARLAYAYASGGSVGKSPPRIAVTEFVGLNKPGIEHAVAQVAVPGLNFPKAALAAVLFLASPRAPHPKAADFVRGMADGIGLQKGDPRIALRDWEVLERRRAKGQIKPQTAFTAAVRAWNAFAQDKTISVVRSAASATRATLPLYGYNPEYVIGATLAGTVGRHARGDAAFTDTERDAPKSMEGLEKNVLDAIDVYVATDDALQDVAARFGLNRVYFGNVLREAGLTRVGGRGQTRGLDYSDVIANYATGDFTFDTLGAKFDTDPSAIYFILRTKAPHLLTGVAQKKAA